MFIANRFEMAARQTVPVDGVHPEAMRNISHEKHLPAAEKSAAGRCVVHTMHFDGGHHPAIAVIGAR
ncbi:MAG: hypothetical protein KDD78_04795 [Caldilineaceae bacterium]|nr:hypothetical protein [Caldilineaceae bacterium]